MNVTTLVRTSLLTVLLAALQVPAQEGAAARNASGGVLLPEQAAYDVLHYDLDVRVDPAARRIDGKLLMRARVEQPLSTVVLDLDGRLDVAAVSVGSEDVPFEHGQGRIRVPLREPLREGSQLEVTVEYGGRPRTAPRPPWDGGFTWARSKDGRPWIATSCQGEGADLWWPCKDHPSDKPETMDLHVTVPKGLVCASNGVLRSVTREGSTRTFHWHVASPISNYNVALNIGPYQVIERTYRSTAGDRVPVAVYVLPEHLAKARKTVPEFLEHLRFFEELCGPYPFRKEKYGVAETPHLGMEHQTIIAYGYGFRKQRPWNYDWLHHHELSHEWWGNLVTCRDWKDMWIHEGFGTYMQALYVERKHGRKAYHKEMERIRRGLANRRPVAPRETRDSKQIYFGTRGIPDNDIYNKGAWVLHSLRWVLGDETFFEALRRMAYPDPALEEATDGSQVRFADTEEIRAIAEKVSERDLRWFFDLYLRQPRLPELVSERRGDTLRLAWKTPDDLPFPMPVAVRAGDRMRRVEMPEGRATVDVGRSRPLEVDPHDWVLREHQGRHEAGVVR